MTVQVPDPWLFNKYRQYTLFVPQPGPGRNASAPLPLVVYFPSFYVQDYEAYTATKLGWESGMEGGDFIVAVPNGMNDCNEANCAPQGLSSVGWNAYGTGVDADGPLGPICAANRTAWGVYPCYSSCRAKSPTGGCQSPCVSASCANDTLFFEVVLRDVMARTCVDESRIYLTGMSVGAMLATEVAMKYAHIVAAAAPAAAGVTYGYWRPPAEPIPFMDIHGHFDDVIPANITNSHRYDLHGNHDAPDGCSFSADGFFYMPSYNWTRDIARVNGCEMRNAAGWNATANASWTPWPTVLDGMAGWQCGLAFGQCPQAAPLVRCTWNGMHEVPLVGKRTHYAHQIIPPNNLSHPQKVHAYARLAWSFLKEHRKTGPRVRL